MKAYQQFDSEVETHLCYVEHRRSLALDYQNTERIIRSDNSHRTIYVSGDSQYYNLWTGSMPLTS